MSKWNKYINGEMSDKESDEFLKQKMTKAFDEDQKKKWSAQLAEEHGIYRQPPRRKLKILVYVGGIAAALLLSLLAYPAFISSTSSTLQARLDQALDTPFPNYLVRKGETEEAEIRIQMAEAYNKKDFQQAIASGEQLLRSDSTSTEDLFFLGLSYLYHGDHARSIQVLSDAQEFSRSDHRFQEEIDWYLALAYLKQESFSKARQVLNKIAEKQQWNSDKANELLLLLNE